MTTKQPDHDDSLAQASMAVTILRTREADRLHLCSLILSANNIPHSVATTAGSWTLLVSPELQQRAIAEIAAYDLENQDWPLRPADPDDFTPYFRAQAVLIVVALLLFYTVTGPWSPHATWFIDGAVDSSRILDNGELYRLFTGLTLHADIVHLLGNCVLGGFLLHFYFLLLGNGIGLAVLLIMAGGANYLNVLAHGPGHQSVGFSTAVFVTIGILSALNYRHDHFSRPARLFLPIMAGAAMLAFLGSGDDSGRTDLGAHFFGLLAGLIAGTLLGFHRLYVLRHNLILQSLLELSSFAIVIYGWIIALR
ncbi:MAG: rhomboid family intramembrane serine protease [Desulfopila sp.]